MRWMCCLYIAGICDLILFFIIKCAKLSGVEAIIKNVQVEDAKVQEKAIWMLERIF